MIYVPVKTPNDFYNNLANSEVNVLFDAEYIDEVRSDELIINDVKFSFNADVWDFSSIKRKNNTTGYKYDFDNNTFRKNVEYILLLKLFLLQVLNEYGMYSSSPYFHFLRIKSFLEFLQNKSKKSINEITLDDVQEFIYEKDDGTRKYRAIENYCTSLQKFLNFCSVSYANVYSLKIKRFLSKRDPIRAESDREKGKLKLLPTSFIKNLKKVLNKHLHDESLPLMKRVICGLILIDVYSGLREQELLIIPYSCTSTDSIDSERIIYLFTYLKTKGVKNGYKHVSQISFKELHDVIAYVKEITKSIRTDEKNEWLIEDSFGIKSSSITDEFAKICTKDAEILGNIDLNEKEHDMYYYRIKSKNVDGIEHKCSMPRLKQLRVYYDSDLRKQGVSSLTIAKFMGHTSAPMIDYYGRDVSGPQEDYDFSAEFLKTTLSENDKLLGPRSKEYSEQINDILKKVDGSIKENYISDDDIEEVLKRMPIRQKCGGVCIKPAIGRPCSFDSNTDEIYCAFGMCPNQIHLYYNMSYYYNVFKSLVDSYQHNKDCGFARAAEKECNKVKYLVKHYLKPEFEELDRKIEECGTEHILSIHPDLSHIIRNIDAIKKEVFVWED